LTELSTNRKKGSKNLLRFERRQTKDGGNSSDAENVNSSKKRLAKTFDFSIIEDHQKKR